MPELPDITIYVEALEARLPGRILENLRLSSPFVLRTAVPPIGNLIGRRCKSILRSGKQILFGFDDEFWLVLHLMIAGRLHWIEGRAKLAGKQNLAAFDFEHGSLVLSEAGTKKRASLHLGQGEAMRKSFDRGGLEVMNCTQQAFGDALTRENHTLKRALTDPRLFSGIGNSYSDEILHAAKLSPVMLTHRLTSEEIKRLHVSTQDTLGKWLDLLRRETGGQFPEKVTAFRAEMAVHGKFGKPCRVCGTKVQRIRYSENETNYCPGCQTGGRLLADRGLSLLLKKDWPRKPEELEEMRAKRIN